MKFFFIFSLIFITNFFSINLKAESSKTLGLTSITSNFVDIKQKSQKIDFLENVLVKNQENSMICDKMTIFYAEKSENDKNSENNSNKTQIKEILAQGNVKIFTKDYIASSDKGFYNPYEEKFILLQNVIVNDGLSIATGQEFIYDLKLEQGEFVGKSIKNSLKTENFDQELKIEDEKDKNQELIKNEEDNRVEIILDRKTLEKNKKNDKKDASK